VATTTNLLGWAGLPLLQTLFPFPHVEISRINTTKIELVSSPFPWQDLFFYYYLKKTQTKNQTVEKETRPTGCECVYI
jgi:hypothetical protein